MLMWWVDFGWLLVLYQATLSLPLLNRTGEENKMERLMDLGKDGLIRKAVCRSKAKKKITHYFPSVIKMVLKKRKEKQDQIQCCMRSVHSAQNKDRIQGQKWELEAGHLLHSRVRKERDQVVHQYATGSTLSNLLLHAGLG